MVFADVPCLVPGWLEVGPDAVAAVPWLVPCSGLGHVGAADVSRAALAPFAVVGCGVLGLGAGQVVGAGLVVPWRLLVGTLVLPTQSPSNCMVALHPWTWQSLQNQLNPSVDSHWSYHQMPKF